MHSRAQIVATLGPSSNKKDVFKEMVENGLDVVRFNFAWGNIAERSREVLMVRETAKELHRHIPIIADLPGPRVKENDGHSYDKTLLVHLTDHDKKCIQFCVDEQIEYIALSFVGSAKDIIEARDFIHSIGGKQKIIAKVERQMALDHIDEIIDASDAIMVARGDLGSEVPLEEIPFVEEMLIKKCNEKEKPVIVATQMMMSMVSNDEPTRADVTDVAFAILQLADAVMLSEETTVGHHPALTVSMMEKVINASEKRVESKIVHTL